MLSSLSIRLWSCWGELVLILSCRCGHIPVALLGGATARVGDPSGKSKERPVLDDETIARNSDGIGEILAKILEVFNLQGFVLLRKQEYLMSGMLCLCDIQCRILVLHLIIWHNVGRCTRMRIQKLLLLIITIGGRNFPCWIS